LVTTATGEKYILTWQQRAAYAVRAPLFSREVLPGAAVKLTTEPKEIPVNVVYCHKCTNEHVDCKYDGIKKGIKHLMF
jgi:hypothetical protein